LSAFLSARTVSYSWGRQTLLKSVTLDVELGRMTVLIGLNGAGKSTLVRLLSGELRPTSCLIVNEGEDLARLPPPGSRSDAR
jgi:ABC-type multidrug transport system ATPase subunit